MVLVCFNRKLENKDNVTNLVIPRVALSTFNYEPRRDPPESLFFEKFYSFFGVKRYRYGNA